MKTPTHGGMQTHTHPEVMSCFQGNVVLFLPALKCKLTQVQIWPSLLDFSPTGMSDGQCRFVHICPRWPLQGNSSQLLAVFLLWVEVNFFHLFWNKHMQPAAAPASADKSKKKKKKSIPCYTGTILHNCVVKEKLQYIINARYVLCMKLPFR